jgi:hypothetical protein
MSATRLLLQTARLSVFSPGSSTAIDVKAWIANQGYYIDVDLLKNEFTLRASNPSELARALANDLNRMAIAAFESAAGVRPDQVLPRSMAWGAIRAYYASFFAAHTFMRMFGASCSQLENDHVNKIFQSAQMFGKTGGLTSVEAGFYSINIDRNFSSVKFRKLKDSHKDTWAELLATIENLEAAIPSATAISQHKIDASALLTDLKSGISSANSVHGNWLSTIRNSINYRHTHGVWFPYSVKAERGELLDAASRNWLNPPSLQGRPQRTGELENFFDVAVMLVSLVRELVTAACELTDPLNPIIKNGCMKLLNELKNGRDPIQ